MPVRNWKFRSGKVSWCYVFDAPGSTKANRRQIKVTGFETKAAATQAEAERRIEEKKKWELAQTHPVASLPKTLGTLLDEFLNEHAAKKLAPKKRNGTESRRRTCRSIY
jgi:hypothetical protein